MKSPVTKRRALEWPKVCTINIHLGMVYVAYIYIHILLQIFVMVKCMDEYLYIYIYDLCEYTTYVNTSAAGIPSAQHFSGLPPRHKA